MDFKGNLKRLRESRGLTRVEIAKRLNMTPAAYGAYELGKREPKFDKLCEIADLLHASIDNLLGYAPHNDANRVAKIVIEMANGETIGFSVLGTIKAIKNANKCVNHTVYTKKDGSQ